MSDGPIKFRSPHIQEALPDLNALSEQARVVCNERKLGFVIIVHDADTVDSYLSSNIPQGAALELIRFTGETTGHGAPRKTG